VPADHALAELLLDAGRAVDRNSPASPTVAFLRVRLLIRRGQLDDARALLATLPDKGESGFNAEAVNMIRAERLMVARTLDEFLAAAPRAVVGLQSVDGPVDGASRFDKPVLDDDAALALTFHLPLDRLADASRSDKLPDRLRRRVALATFARAVVLWRDDIGQRVAVELQRLAPAIRADLDRYIGATSADDRHIAGVLLLVRTPGMHAYVQGLEDDVSYALADPSRQLDYLFHRNWWCEFDKKPDQGRFGFRTSELIDLLYPGPDAAQKERVPYPSFISASERQATEQEIEALATAGAARSYLAAEAISWARARPHDPDAAEALARIVDGWRRACGDEQEWELSRSAFQTLHRLFPQSEWATRTKYWYK